MSSIGAEALGHPDLLPGGGGVGGSLAFFFIFSSLMPLSMASASLFGFSFSVTVKGAVHTSFSFSPPPVPGTTEPAALVAVPCSSHRSKCFHFWSGANVLAAHVHDVEFPPVLLEKMGQAWHALPSKYCAVVQLIAVSQLEPLYPDVHVHLQDPAVPLTVRRLCSRKYRRFHPCSSPPRRYMRLQFRNLLHRVPALHPEHKHDPVVPLTVPPLMQ